MYGTMNHATAAICAECGGGGGEREEGEEGGGGRG